MSELQALAALRLHPVEHADDVWRPSPFHVEALYPAAERVIGSALEEARQSQGASPVGLAVRGIRGTGKTHLLGWLRERTQAEGGYFFLVGLLDAKGFWESVVISLLEGLARPSADGRTQLAAFLAKLAAETNLPRMKRREADGRSPLTRATLDELVEKLRLLHPRTGREQRDVARALVLLGAGDLGLQDIGESFLTCVAEGEPGERGRWGISGARPTPQEIVRGISRLLALTGHCVIAVDQIDTLLAQAGMTTSAEEGFSWNDRLVVERVGGGLMSLREVTSRTLTVLSCLPSTWTLIQKHATDSVQDRFREVPFLQHLGTEDRALALVARRFAVRFSELGFEPAYPTWPVRPEYLREATEFTPRQLLLDIDRHVQDCLKDGVVRELGAGASVPSVPVAPTEHDHAEVDALWAGLRSRTDQNPRLEPDSEDQVMPPLLAAGLAAWIMEQGPEAGAYRQDAPPSAKPALHARLRRALDERTEDEIHWAFRAISAKHHNAVLSRLRVASVAAGLDSAVPKRRLFVLRNGAWPGGPVTRTTVEEFEKRGGRVLPLGAEDLALLGALRDLLAVNPPGLADWLATRRPTRDLAVFQDALGDPAPATPAEGVSTPDVRSTPRLRPTPDVGSTPDVRSTPDTPSSLDTPSSPDTPSTPGTPSTPSTPSTPGRAVAPSPPAKPSTKPAAPPVIPVGRDLLTGTPTRLDLEALRKHAVIFAGSGSGKTVLIRRLIEECALLGVSAIVLDPNNDLARLGDPWPQPHHEAARAEEYLHGAEVVVWTPRRDGGRPLVFQPLPDFTAVIDDPDEFNEAVESAVASLIPRAKLEGRTAKTHRGQALLREAIDFYGRRGRTGLAGLVDLLCDLPDGLSTLDGAHKIAAEIGESLKAAMIIDPLFGGSGAPADPGVLLTPSPGRRARISVISFVGLQADDQRQSFVNQLQMALFAWIRKNPAGDRPLGGLFVMDEAQTFAPSGTMTACTQSTLALAAQARKYGLGLVFATQAPRGLHNRIPGNAATQFFGLLNAPAQIAAARELASAKGSSVDDIARLRTGQFYAALDGEPFVKIQAPLCLSHHPRAPLSVEEVLERSRR
ncbi:ATP-binding protein [Nonomuraea soli]|uniref:AAA+ ATPase domain-containing protein n=1 Tax=Nonomuraea soli TaxID=1032476 RepID=A0A7W0CDN4_9ACTN|nr:ATP-binding protein [Nonomuraea soli]MBA2889260.1 hypothetical protein [Nonomuraea soli]